MDTQFGHAVPDRLDIAEMPGRNDPRDPGDNPPPPDHVLETLEPVAKPSGLFDDYLSGL